MLIVVCLWRSSLFSRRYFDSLFCSSELRVLRILMLKSYKTFQQRFISHTSALTSRWHFKGKYLPTKIGMYLQLPKHHMRCCEFYWILKLKCIHSKIWVSSAEDSTRRRKARRCVWRRQSDLTDEAAYRGRRQPGARPAAGTSCPTSLLGWSSPAPASSNTLLLGQ